MSLAARCDVSAVRRDGPFSAAGLQACWQPGCRPVGKPVDDAGRVGKPVGNPWGVAARRGLGRSWGTWGGSRGRPRGSRAPASAAVRVLLGRTRSAPALVRIWCAPLVEAPPSGRFSSSRSTTSACCLISRRRVLCRVVMPSSYAGPTGRCGPAAAPLGTGRQLKKDGQLVRPLGVPAGCSRCSSGSSRAGFAGAVRDVGTVPLGGLPWGQVCADVKERTRPQPTTTGDQQQGESLARGGGQDQRARQRARLPRGLSGRTAGVGQLVAAQASSSRACSRASRSEPAAAVACSSRQVVAVTAAAGSPACSPSTIRTRPASCSRTR